MGKVVHCKREQYDVYIGRPGRWGNPFVLRAESEREDVLEKYRVWLWNEIREGGFSLEELSELSGKVLGCWCAPKTCHGDVLLRAAQWAENKLQEVR
jgi:Domain of unknown function (DUF4326)